MAGLWIQSLQYAFDEYGKPVPGAIASFFQAATLMALTVYQDADLGVPVFGSEVKANARGQFPPVFLDDTVASSYRFRTTKPDGQILNDLVTLPINPGSSSGGGGGTAIDPTQLLTTGDVIWKPQVAPVGGRPGWVRCNSNTIGANGSSATELKGPPAQGLFIFLWSNFSDAECPVTPGGRGLDALADWNNNRAIATPDLRGRGLIGADQMGAATAAGRITGATIAQPDDIGAVGGSEKVTLTVTQLPAHHHTVDPPINATSMESAVHSHPMGFWSSGVNVGHTHAIDPPATMSSIESVAHAHMIDAPPTGTTLEGGHTHSFSDSGTTSGQSASHTHTYNNADYSATRTPGGSTTTNNANTGNTGAASNDHTHTFSVSGTTGAGSAHQHVVDIAPFTSAVESANHTHSVDIVSFTSGAQSNDHQHYISGTSAEENANHYHTIDIYPFDSADAGGGSAVVTLPPVMIGTWWMKI